MNRFIENHYEAVIDKNDFELVQKLLKLDLRTSPNEETLYPFAGILFCADCGAPMTRKVTTSRGKRYYAKKRDPHRQSSLRVQTCQRRK